MHRYTLISHVVQSFLPPLFQIHILFLFFYIIFIKKPFYIRILVKSRMRAHYSLAHLCYSLKNSRPCYTPPEIKMKKKIIYYDLKKNSKQKKLSMNQTNDFEKKRRM